MASEDVPAKRRLAGFVRALSSMMADATNAAMVIEEDAKEEATIREIVAEYFGGRIADDTDARDALEEAVAVLRGDYPPETVPTLGLGKIGGLICGLVREHEQALVALHQIHAVVRGEATPVTKLPVSIKPVDVLVEVDEAISRTRGWSSQRGEA